MPRDTPKQPDRAIATDLPDILQDQQERQTRLRHLQEFIGTPTFLDLSDMPIEVADDDEALAERQRDLEYRSTILRSVLSLLEGEIVLLEKLRSGGTGCHETDAESGSDSDAQTE